MSYLYQCVVNPSHFSELEIAERGTSINLAAMSAVWNVHRVSPHLQRPSLCVSWLRKVNSELSLSRGAGRQNPQLGPDCLRATLICDICCVMKRLIAPLIITPTRHFDSPRLEVAHPQIFMFGKIPALTKNITYRNLFLLSCKWLNKS